jgi:hypothetical protein
MWDWYAVAYMRWNPRRVLPDGLPERAWRPSGALARLARVGGPASEAVETVGFWAAVLLPLCYVPLLATGLSSGADAGLLAILVLLHVLALSAGHRHNRS